MPERFLVLNAQQIFVATTVLENTLAALDADATQHSRAWIRKVVADYILRRIHEVADENDIPELVEGCLGHIRKALWRTPPGTAASLQPIAA